MTNNNQSGRSMIEMLGVLAIIGVLSVGGIAGYSKAMMKFKINKTIDQISQIAQNTRTLYARQKNYGSLSGKVVYKANLAPREMFEGSGSYGMTNAFGGEVIIETGERNASGDKKAFVIGLASIPEEACIELATQDWGDGDSSGLIAVAVSDGASYAARIYRENACQLNGAHLDCDGSKPAIPMSIDTAVNLCSGNDNTVSFKFY